MLEATAVQSYSNDSQMVFMVARGGNKMKSNRNKLSTTIHLDL